MSTYFQSFVQTGASEIIDVLRWLGQFLASLLASIPVVFNHKVNESQSQWMFSKGFYGTIKLMGIIGFRSVGPSEILLKNCYLVRYLHKTSKMDAGPAFLKEKERYLNMSQEERRNKYEKDVLTLDMVETWNNYYKNNFDRLQKVNKHSYINQFSIIPSEHKTELNEKVSLWKGDITKLEVDAIVNAANNSLLGGFGVDGAIHDAAGKFLYDECKTLLGCVTGDAKITGGYQLPAKYVIHTVGPRGEKPDLLVSCYVESLKKLVANNLRTIAFPCISTGVYGYPQDLAANVALQTVRKFLESNSSLIDRVVFCLFLEKDVEIYEAMMQIYFPV